MQNADLVALTAMLVALQFAAFGWRISREIGLVDQKRRVWLPVPDILNLISMMAVLWADVVLPLAHGIFFPAAKITLAVGFVLIGFHPLSMAGHYCLFSKNGRETYPTPDGDWRYFPPPEIRFVAASLLASAAVGWYVARFVYR
jgi:hypothetical protein